MQIGRVTGKVVATIKLGFITGLKFLMVQPLGEDEKPIGEEIVAVDTVQAGVDELVFYVTGREATLPLPAPVNPVDATIVGIVDSID